MKRSLKIAGDKPSARQAPSDAWFPWTVPIRYKSSVHLYYLLAEQFAAANCFSKLPFLDTWRGLHGIRFHDSPYQIES